MNLIIGNNSQLSRYFPEDYIKVSGRNITKSTFVEEYENVYITFAEQRTFDTELKENDFMSVNVEYTKRVVDYLTSISKRIVLFGTAELWNNCDGPIDIDTPINYNYSPYIKSKEVLWQMIQEKKLSGNWKNVIIVHPFNFNSIYRKDGFLFYKIFDSLINKTINEVGNINIERDLIHPKYLVEQSIYCEKDVIVGSGKTINIKNFIEQLFTFYNMDVKNYIKEKNYHSHHQNNIFWYKTESKYEGLLNDTLYELNNIMKNEKY